jgi:flagellar protein FlaJ
MKLKGSKMIDKIKANIRREREIISYLIAVERVEKGIHEQEFYKNVQNALLQELKILNSAIPELLSAIQVAEERKIERAEERVRRRIVSVQGDLSVKTINKEEYMKTLQIEAEYIKLLKKKISQKKLEKKEKIEESYARVGDFTKLSGKIFSNVAFGLSRSDTFKPLADGLRKANMPYLLTSYISMMLLGTLISFFASLFIAGFVIYSEILSPIYGIAIVFVIPAIMFMIFYFYPSGEASSTKSQINDELPFAIMHMSAIAGSGIEPSKVFGILAVSNEYPALRKEMIKIMNQINFYGYNIVSALRATAKTTPNERFADFLNGIATTISSGGNLKEYLKNIAADTLLDYKLRRKRFTTISETYADIYTGLLVAAPLMFMLILVLMNVIGGGFGGMSTSTIAIIGIGALIVVNIGFLVFLEISQPES